MLSAISNGDSAPSIFKIHQDLPHQYRKLQNSSPQYSWENKLLFPKQKMTKPATNTNEV
jgi:hypothetical protein